MTLTPGQYAFLGLTGLVAAIVAALTFAVLRLVAAARDARGRRPASGGDTAILSAALADAVSKLRAQERATAARADASERLSEEIIAGLSAGLLVVGLDGSVRILNPAGRRMLNLPASAPLGPHRTMLKLAALSDVIDECFAQRAPLLRRTIVPPADAGGATHIGVTVSPLFEQGELSGAIGLFTDLTAVKALEEQLRLKESLAAVGELTAGIAHEFRNGLATILGYSKLFDPGALPENYRPYVHGIRAEAESLGQVVTNFLNFAKPAQLSLGTVDLRAVCERASDEVRADVRTLCGDVTVRGTFGTIEGDEVLLKQAFSNLLRNALEACVGAGVAPVIVVEGRHDPAHQTVHIAVDDNGPGVDPAARDQVFRPFFTSKRSGTGLGLALVQKIIVFHNGRVTVGQSELGGASLRVMLPVNR